MGTDFTPLPTWLPAAIYRVIADPEAAPTHRNILYSTFSDFPAAALDAVVDGLLEYGCIREEGATERQHGDLTIEPYPTEEPT